MSSFYLIRHGDHDWLPKGIAGRTPCVSLNAKGEAQAEALVARLSAVQFNAIYSSPLERAQQSAQPLARARNQQIITESAINELDFAEWSGATWEKLHNDPRWALWNRQRSVTRMPGGETMPEVQSRIVGLLVALHAKNPNATSALFSHGDSIRAAICHWLGTPLDLLPRLEIEPASISILRLTDAGPMIGAINVTS